MVRPLFAFLMFFAIASATFCTVWTVVELIKYLMVYSVSISAAIPLDIHFNFASLVSMIICYVLATIFGILAIRPSRNGLKY